MSGAAVNMEKGIVGGTIVLDVKFYAYTVRTDQGGPLVDDDRWGSDSQLPIVRIYDPDNILKYNTIEELSTKPVRNSIGDYEFTYIIPSDGRTGDTWKIEWSIRIGGNDLTFSEYFRVGEPGDASFGTTEYRKGVAFDNPQNSDRYAKDWGILITPDELRYECLFGTKLVSPDASQTYDDNMLYYYIDSAIAILERDLNIDILPRLIRHQDTINQATGQAIPRVWDSEDQAFIDVLEQNGRKEHLLIRENAYPYRQRNQTNFMYIKLRRRPLLRIKKAVILDPYFNYVLDLWPYRRENLGFVSSVKFIPGLANFEFFTRNLLNWGPLSGYPYDNIPAYFIDYDTGYEKAKDVPHDIRFILFMMAGIMLLNDYGDGKSPGLASSSINLNSVSESYATTQSATNALYGARILQYSKQIKNWLDANRKKFSSEGLGVL